MGAWLRRVLPAAVRLAKRFLSNRPNSPYEAIAFGAVRASTLQFGKA